MLTNNYLANLMIHSMLTNNYLANLIVKDHRKRILEDARKAHLSEAVKKPNSKDRKHRHLPRIGKSLEFFGLRLQNKKI